MNEANAESCDALVVFTGDHELWWQRLLKPGFRHCFILLRRGTSWVELQPLSHYLMVSVGSERLSKHRILRTAAAKGWTVTAARSTTPPRRCALLWPFTCVGLIKFALGVRAPLAWTPWALHRVLERDAPKTRLQEINP